MSEIRIWRAVSGKLFARLPVRPNDIFADSSGPMDIVAFTEDDSFVVTHATEGEVSLWPLFADPQQLVDKMIATVPRCLSRPQRRMIGLDQGPPAWCMKLQKWPY
jgi:hypothetical protein